MNENRPQPAGVSPLAAIEARVDRIRQGIAAQQNRLNRSSRLTAIIGSALCVLMAFYFYYFYDQVRKIIAPTKIIAAAEDVVVEALPGARKELERQINESANDWAVTISTNLQENLPRVREQAEDFIMNKVAEATDQVQVLSGARFRTFVQQNKPMLAEGFQSLKKPQDAERFLADLKTVLESNMASDMREQSEDMLHTLFQLNRKLALLKEGAGPGGKSLDSEQVLEREALMIAKRLQIETALEETDDNSPMPKKKAAARGANQAETHEPAAKPAGGAVKRAKGETESAEKAQPGDKD